MRELSPARDRLDTMEPFYPLHAWVCHECFLVQINDYVTADHIFDEYAYFSSFSSTWLEHASKYVADMTDRLDLDEHSFVVELASQRRVPAAVLRRTRRAVPRHRARSERRPGGDRQGCADRRVVFRQGQGGRDGGRGQAGRSRLRRQRDGSGAGSQRLRRRDPDDPQAGRHRHDRVPARDDHDRGQPVRPDLPRALLLLRADQRRGGLRRSRHDDLRRRRALDPRRFAADLRPPRGRRESPGVRSGARPASSRGGGRLQRRGDVRQVRSSGCARPSASCSSC